MLGGVTGFFHNFRGFKPDAKKLVTATVLASIGDTFIWFLLLLYLNILSYAPNEIGMVIFLRSIFSTLPMVPMGYLSDRMGRRKMIFLGIFVNIMGMALHVTANSLLEFYVAASVWGFSHSLYQPSYLGFLSAKVSEERRKFLFSYQMFCHQMAAAFTILIAGFLPAFLSTQFSIVRSDGFKIVFLLGMLFMLAQLFPIMLTAEDKRKAGKKKVEKKTRYKELPPMPRQTVLKLCVPMVLFGLGAGLFVEFLPVYFVWRFDREVADIGILYFLTFFIWALMYLPMPALAEKGGSVKAITAVHSFAILALLAIPASPIFTLAAIAHITRMVLMNSTWPIFNSYALGHVPKEHSSLTMSATGFSFNSMRAITPLAAGYLFGISLALPFMIASVLYTIAVIAFYVLFIGKEEKGTGGKGPPRKPLDDDL